MVIKAQSPAGFAEEYIIESIWNNRFPPGTILPAERELSELIGVTRTTLREVLQRLARDGWLTDDTANVRQKMIEYTLEHL